MGFRTEGGRAAFEGERGGIGVGHCQCSSAFEVPSLRPHTDRICC